MDQETKTLLLPLTFIAVFGVVAYFGFQHLGEREAQCQKVNGIMVKGIDGWVCIDARRL